MYVADIFLGIILLLSLWIFTAFLCKKEPGGYLAGSLTPSSGLQGVRVTELLWEALLLLQAYRSHQNSFTCITKCESKERIHTMCQIWIENSKARVVIRSWSWNCVRCRKPGSVKYCLILERRTRATTEELTLILGCGILRFSLKNQNYELVLCSKFTGHTPYGHTSTAQGSFG